MAVIKDSTQSSVTDHRIDLTVSEKNLRALTADETLMHLDMLAQMLTMTRKMVAEKLPREGGNNKELLNYLDKLDQTLDAIVLKNRLEAEKPNNDIRIPCSIDPSDSGFPIFVRDFKFLNTDKEAASQQLSGLPDDAQMVDDALFMLFRGHFPKNVILDKMTGEYYGTLRKLSLPEPLSIYPETLVESREQGMNYCIQSFERLDEHSNIPRFYTLYLKIPAVSYKKHEWRRQMLAAITQGISTVTNLELAYLAKEIEAVEGVQVECIERYDIGPFYNKFTNNQDMPATLVESDEDCMILFRKHSVIRTGQKKREGFRNWWKGLSSGDRHLGEFSPMIASPQYILMPHRMAQRAYSRNLFMKNAKMYGITAQGDIND